MSEKYTGEKWAKKALCLPIDVMVTEYRQAKDPKKMIDILADQCEVNPCRIAWILDRCGLAVDPKKLPRALRGDESFDYVSFWENSDDAVVCDRIRKQIRAAQSMPEFDEPAREMLKPYPAAAMEPAKNGCAEEKEAEREGKNVDARMFETDSQFIKRVTEEYGVTDDDLAEMQGESAGITRRREVLMSAAICVCTDRNLMYGEPEDSFGLISQLWSDFLGIPVSENDVMDMMILLKVARNGRAKVRKRDTYVDIAGYAACAGGGGRRMSMKEGSILICDRCGSYEFIAKNDPRKPEGWDGYRWKPNTWGTAEYRDLCPKCKEEYEKIYIAFMNAPKKKEGEDNHDQT